MIITPDRAMSTSGSRRGFHAESNGRGEGVRDYNNITTRFRRGEGKKASGKIGNCGVRVILSLCEQQR